MRRSGDGLLPPYSTIVSSVETSMKTVRPSMCPPDLAIT
jgi:hypothetical protein